MTAAPEPFRLRRGSGKLIVSIPHAGTFVPPAIAARLTPAGQPLPDTDWHVDRLYGFLEQTEATLLIATHSRYVVDLNRGPEGAPLYPGQAETGIVPNQTFAGEPLWQEPPPDAAEIALRIATFWQPYHDTLRAELARLRSIHPRICLFDAHSIRSEIPRLFSGTLPELSFGTHDGAAAAPARLDAAIAVAGDSFGIARNARFKGGYITRHYGHPARGIDAIQLEIAQRAYLDERRPSSWNPERAARLQPILRRILSALAGETTVDSGTKPAPGGL